MAVKITGAAVAVEFELVAGDGETVGLQILFLVAVCVHVLKGAGMEGDSFVAV